MLNLTSSLFSTFFHRNITSKPFFQKSLNNQKLPSFTTSNHFQLLFNLLDSDGDGKISTKELSQFLYRLGYKKLKPTMEAEEMVKEMDSDRDGFIEMDEFLE
ncbi:calmodulin-like protein 7 [Cucumis melo var. makuwa]|uniref:Calmodulin-like protein 7 n=1 Tax=Cucumis melo var. makuwa TaxID=1194695 RepID=A0A5A7TEW8_CUCMM|nr:calmodulin-like protein 7 [Cucumis melo var. makuwa]